MKKPESLRIMSVSTNPINAGEVVVAIVIRELKPDILRGTDLSGIL